MKKYSTLFLCIATLSVFIAMFKVESDYIRLILACVMAGILFLWLIRFGNYMMKKDIDQYDKERNEFYRTGKIITNVKENTEQDLRDFYNISADINGIDFDNLSKEQKNVLRNSMSFHWWKLNRLTERFGKAVKALLPVLLLSAVCYSQPYMSYIAAGTDDGPAIGFDLGYRLKLNEKEKTDYLKAQFSGYTNPNSLIGHGNDEKFPNILLWQAGYSKAINNLEIQLLAGACYYTISVQDLKVPTHDLIPWRNWYGTVSARLNYNISDVGGFFIGGVMMKDKIAEVGLTYGIK